MVSNSDRNTDLLIVIPPLGMKNTVYPPYGSMYIASALRDSGYVPEILDIDTERITIKEIIERIKEIDPKYIGISGIIATSYIYVKELSREIRRAFPHKTQILGGGLSSAALVVLNNSDIDIVVCGEGDVTIVELIKCLEGKGDLKSIAGICYRKDSKPVFTDKRQLIINLDKLPYPAFDLVNMDKYLPDGVGLIRKFGMDISDERIYSPSRKKRMITIPTSRGCFNECSFCFRAYKGLRVHSIKYIFDFIEYCIEKFNVGFFTFGDECFAPSKKRNWEFIEEYKRRKLDIIFRILGMRVDTVDRDILHGFKEIGCWMIEYGFESGSQRMLNIINKRVTVKQNVDAALWTKEAGIYTSPALVLGMPGETDESIEETIEFLKSLNFNFKQYQWKYAIPIPGSQLYKYAKLIGIIKDEDKYLSSLAGDAGDGNFSVNLTDLPDRVVAGWAGRLKNSLDMDYLDRNRKKKNRLPARFAHFIMLVRLNYRKGTLLTRLKKRASYFMRSPLKPGRMPGTGRIDRQFRKDKSIDSMLRGTCSGGDQGISLKKINRRLIEEKRS
ncbi:MAG: radical SAM protein [Candidatus Omnitrophota bacterium]